MAKSGKVIISFTLVIDYTRKTLREEGCYDSGDLMLSLEDRALGAIEAAFDGLSYRTTVESSFYEGYISDDGDEEGDDE